MGAWYWIGVATGLGVAAGIAIGALLPAGTHPGDRRARRAARRRGRNRDRPARRRLGRGGRRAGSAGCSARCPSVPIVAGALRGGGTRFGVGVIVALAGVGLAALAFVPGRRLRGGGARAAVRPPTARGEATGATPGCASSPKTDEEARPDRDRRPDPGGLRASGRERGRARAVLPRRLGNYRRALSTFPSLTPVCASSIATGAHPDVHHIPHLVWYDRDERRLVEYGSSLRRARRGRNAALDRGHDLQHERPPPLARRRDRVRVARRRGPRHGRGQLHLLPRAHRAPRPSCPV